MKKVSLIRVTRIHLPATPFEVISKVNKVKGIRVASIIFADNLPRSTNQPANNVINLSEKQMNNLCNACGIPQTGRVAWNILQKWLLRGGFANVSSEEHTAGDKYVDPVTKEEKEYTETSTSCQIDSIVLPEKIVDKIQAGTFELVNNYRESEDAIAELLKSPVEEIDIKVS